MTQEQEEIAKTTKNLCDKVDKLGEKIKSRTINKKELQGFLEGKQSQPVLLGYIDKGNIGCFAGTFTLEELCFMKEVLVRKIDSMLNQAIKMDVTFERKVAPVKDISNAKGVKQ